MTDPDRGSWTFQVRADSQPVIVVDGRGWAWIRGFGRLGRVINEYEDRVPDQSFNWNLLHTWTWDTRKLGQLSQTRRYVGGTTGHVRELYYDLLSRPSKEEVTIYEGVDANAPISVPNPNWLGAAFERTSQYDSHYGWVKAQYQGPKVANYSHDTRAKAGAYTQVWHRDRYGHTS